MHNKSNQIATEKVSITSFNFYEGNLCPFSDIILKTSIWALVRGLISEQEINILISLTP